MVYLRILKCANFGLCRGTLNPTISVLTAERQKEDWDRKRLHKGGRDRRRIGTERDYTREEEAVCPWRHIGELQPRAKGVWHHQKLEKPKNGKCPFVTREGAALDTLISDS